MTISQQELAVRLAERERELAALRAEVERWREHAARLPLRDDSDFSSVSGVAVEPVYTPLDLSPGLWDATRLPGEFPYT
ncbi:MAG: hypothetical protein ACM357_05040, partial [Gemmatimonadota bacterium]